MKKAVRHFLGLRDVPADTLREILQLASRYKAERTTTSCRPLAGQTWALIFSKSSTRTRVSFEVGIRELGGSSLFLNANDLQLGRGEPIRDTARVMGRMIHGAIIRTFGQSDIDEFAKYSQVPTVNALTDDEHPCQILADIMTIEERLGPIAGKKIAFIGDCACNVPRSWIFAANTLGFQLVLAGPPDYMSDLENPNVSKTQDVRSAAKDADVLYTDVWVSMGLEAEKAQRATAFQGFQIDAGLVALAGKDALVLHCLPAYRGQEITDDVLEAHASEIFEQAENRLHAQKGVLHWLTETEARPL